MTQKNVKIFSGLAIVIFIALGFLKMETWDALSYAVSAAALADWLYDRVLWRINPLEKTPRLYGTYHVTGVSTFNGHTPYTSLIKITQTLSSISVVETSESGCCESVTATLARTTQDGPWFLYYTYLSHPKVAPTENNKDDMHYGTAIFHVTYDGVLDGSYFTNRTSQTAGNMTLKRIRK